MSKAGIITIVIAALLCSYVASSADLITIENGKVSFRKPVTIPLAGSDTNHTDTRHPAQTEADMGAQTDQELLKNFERAVDAKMDRVYHLLNTELESRGTATGYSDTLTYVLLQLCDIKYAKLATIKGAASGNPGQMRTKIAEKNSYINGLIQRYRIPITQD